MQKENIKESLMKWLQAAATTLGWKNKSMRLELLAFRSLEKGLHGAGTQISGKGALLSACLCLCNRTGPSTPKEVVPASFHMLEKLRLEPQAATGRKLLLLDWGIIARIPTDSREAKESRREEWSCFFILKPCSSFPAPLWVAGKREVRFSESLSQLHKQSEVWLKVQFSNWESCWRFGGKSVLLAHFIWLSKDSEILYFLWI